MKTVELQDGSGTPVHLGVFQKAERSGRLRSEEDVFGGRKMGIQSVFLKNHADAGLPGVVRARDVRVPAADPDRSRIAGVHPVQDLHQR